MPFSNDYLIYQLLLPAAILAILFWSVVGAAVGAGLIVSSAQTFRLFGFMNHYVSTRHGLKSLAVPYDLGRSAYRYRYLVGASFIVGSIFSIYNLIAWFDSAAIVATLDLDYPAPFVAWIVESVRWCLLLFGAFAFITGVMLVSFPDALKRFEAHLNRWISLRQLAAGVDTMHLPLDRLAAAFPRSMGAIVLVAALYVAVNAAILWFRFR